jgi:prepilin-type N-terminal cleavage/methylation domain-containing protein
MTSSRLPRKLRAASRRRAKSIRLGFTLLEVLAGVLVLGLLYTVLAGAAMRGLRSEGNDRRRAEAALLADRELATVEMLLAAGEPISDGAVEKEEPPYLVRIDVQPEDVLALLPRELQEDVARTTDQRGPSALRDERGQSRVRRVSVHVEWDEAGQPDFVERTTYAYDPAALQALFPSEEGDAAGAEEEPPEDNSFDALRREAPPELQSLIDQAEQGQP